MSRGEPKKYPKLPPRSKFDIAKSDVIEAAINWHEDLNNHGFSTETTKKLEKAVAELLLVMYEKS